MLSGRHAFVTGANGFVGANLVRALLARNCSVTILQRATSDDWRLADLHDRITVRTGELESGALSHCIDSADVRDLVFHLGAAGVKPGVAAADVVAANVLGTARLLDFVASAAICRRLVLASSCSVYGEASGATEDHPLRGDSVYALTKIANESMARSYSVAGVVPAVTLRLFTPYGPYEAAYRLVAGTVLKALRGEDITATEGRQKRDLIYIDDLVDATIAAAVADGVEGEVLNVCTGRSISVREAVEIILRCVGSDSRPRFGALPYRDNEIWEMSGDATRMSSRLNVPPPRSFEQGLAETAAWFRRYADVLYPPSSGR